MISTPIRRHDLVGNGTAGPFTYQFLIRAASDLLVYVDGNLKTLTTHYTVSGVGSETGGTVTFTTGNEPAVNAHVQIVGSEPYTQTADFQTAATLPAAALEEVLDKQTRLLTQLNERATRMPVMSLPDAYNKPAIGLSAPVAGQFLRWDALAQNLEPAVPTTVPSGLPVGGNYDHLTINGSGVVTWDQQVYNFSANMVNVSKYASFAAAVTAISSTVTTLLVSSSKAITGNVSVPKTLRVILEGQGDFDISTGVTLTFDNPEQILAHPRRRIFKGAGSVAFTNKGTVYPGWWGAVGDGVTDDTSAFLAAIATGCTVRVLDPNAGASYRLTAKLTLGTGQTMLGSGKHTTKLLHDFNGDMMELGSKASLQYLYLEGQGATRTGKGVLFTGTNGDQHIDHCKIIEFDSQCLDFASLAGSRFSSVDCEIHRYNSATTTNRFAIVIDPIVSVGATPRKFVGLEMEGSCSFDFGGCNGVLITNSFMGDLKFTADSRDVQICTSRIANDVALDLNGNNNSLVACDISPQLTLVSGTTEFAVSGCSLNTPPVIDNSVSSSNLIHAPEAAYTPTWGSTGTAPAIGNGTLTGRYSRQGSSITCTINLTIGSTTALGTGDWRFSLPQARINADVVIAGSGVVNDGGTQYVAAAVIGGNLSYCVLTRDTSGNMGNFSPLTLTANDTIRITMTYGL